MPISNINLATESFGRKGSMSQQLGSMKPQFKSISENKKSGVKVEGYYGKPDGTGATAWPVYQGSKK